MAKKGIYQKSKYIIQLGARANLRNPRFKQKTPSQSAALESNHGMHQNKRHLHIMKILALMNTQNALMYTHLVSFQSSKYYPAVANTIYEARNLIESGFKFICDME